MHKSESYRGKFQYIFLFGLILCLAGVLLAQNTTDKILVVNGRPTGAVMQIGGHSYIDIETLAQITNGTFTVEPKRIVLTIPDPGSGSAPAANSNAAPAPASQGLSREFARTAIAELAEMREWRGAIGTILTFGVPVVGTWPQDYRDRSEANLAQVAVTATTADDQQALQLLQNEFSNLAQWARDTVATRQSLNATKTVDPNAMQNDTALAKLSTCGRFLNSMLVSGVFADHPSCH
jgi:hypothetical protein